MEAEETRLSTKFRTVKKKIQNGRGERRCYSGL
ncbi:BnaCnng42200D [Brassica napus]|uniref:BnaCnng42200D protein n=1 Tax=Brassica napus TaxID=3708 RepID=A0A078JEZ2_BRANA|nr:BnaCnng42200D [Brassica napus]